MIAAIEAGKSLQPYPDYSDSNMGQVMAGREFCQDGQWRELGPDDDGTLVEFRCTLAGGAEVLNERHTPEDAYASLEDAVVWKVIGDSVEAHSATLYVTRASGEVREIETRYPALMLSAIITEEYLEPESTPDVREVIATRSSSLYFNG